MLLLNHSLYFHSLFTSMQNETSRLIAKELGREEAPSEIAIQIMQMVAELEGIALSEKSKRGAATIGGAMHAYDAAFDRFDIRTARDQARKIQGLVNGENTPTDIDPNVRRAIELAHDNLNPSALSALKDLTIAQVDSLGQRDGSADQNKITDITKRKGASTVLLFALEVSPDMTDKRRKCFEELGYLIQLIDDFHDQTVDIKDGIATLATTLVKPEVLALIKNQYRVVRELFGKEYEEHKLGKMFAYVDKLMAKSGIL